MMSRSSVVGLLLGIAAAAGCENNYQQCTVALKEVRITPASPSVAVGESLMLKAEYSWCAGTESERINARWQLRTASDSVYLSVQGDGKVTGRSARAAVVVDYYFQGDTTPRGYVQVTVR